jgi:predicted DNA-binding transcriptional regulator YafY
MSRAQRLLDLIQLLRGYRRPVSGAVLAEALGISLRTLYRDIETLNAQGAHIDGEPGVGYILRPGFMLPPLMFSEEEIEAIVLGSRWVADRTDAALSGAARSALAKISAVLPPDLKDGLDTSALLIGPGQAIAAGDAELPVIRSAIRNSASCASSIRTAADAVQSATSGLLRWVFSTACVSSWHGANSARAFGISAPTVSARCKSWTSATRAAGRSC